MEHNELKIPENSIRDLCGDHWPPMPASVFKLCSDLNTSEFADYQRAFARKYGFDDSKFSAELDNLLITLPKIIDSKANVGLEIEVEGISENWSGLYPGSWWRWAHDNSLKDAGVEFISYPLKAASVRNALALLWACFNSYNNERIKFGWRSSIHVHLDMHNKTVEDLINFLLIYSTFEDTLFHFAGEKRSQSIFCVPMSQTILGEKIGKILHGKMMPGHIINIWEKYSALNLLPLSKYGTIEFRQLAGTRNLSKIIHWINMILRMDQYARANSFANLSHRILALNTNSLYDQLKEEVFGPELMGQLQDPALAQHMSDGVKYAKTILSKPAYAGSKIGVKSAIYGTLSSLAEKNEKKTPSYLSSSYLDQLLVGGKPQDEVPVNENPNPEDGEQAVVPDWAQHIIHKHFDPPNVPQKGAIPKPKSKAKKVIPNIPLVKKFEWVPVNLNNIADEGE